MSEQVTFYSWIENSPSSLTVRIDGGHMSHNGESAKLGIEQPLKEVRFNKGILRTDDAQTIKTLRKLMTQGETITEDHEVYLAKVTTVEQQAKRAVTKNEILVEENRDLRRQLEAKAKKDPVSRLGKADAADAASAA